MLQNFLNWLEDRTGVVSLLKVIGNRRWPAFLMGMKMWPAIISFLVVIQCITGFILWMHYAPASKSAYESVFYIQNVLWGGWLLRGIHHFSAQCLVAAGLLYVLRRVFFGTYTAPREVTYWLALLIFFCGLGACLTGDLLPWTQNGYGATMVRVKYLTQIPVVGGMLYQLAVGGDTVNTITLSHFTALHIGIFAAGLIVLLVIHGVCDARAEKRWLDEKLASGEIKVPAQKENACGGCRTTGIARWWSCQAAFNALACLLVSLIVLYLALGQNFGNLGNLSPVTQESGEVVHPGQYLGVTLGPPADVSPTTSFGTARPEWTFRGLYQYALNFAGKASEFVLIFIVPTILVGVFFVMPFIAKFWKYGHIFNITYTAVLGGIMIGLTMTSYRNDAADENYTLAQQEERNDAHRVWELAQERGGLSEQGALAMLQADWKTQGPKLFAKHCASCHPNAAADTVKDPLAPNLFRYGTKDWMAGWLDKAAIRSPEFYGYKDSPLLEESMVEYVRDTLPEYLADEDLGPDGVKRIVEVLAAEAKLTEPRKMVGEGDEALPEGINEDDYYAFEDYGCVGCHPFYGFDGDTKTGPDLTMYASKEWTKKVIADPTKQYSVNDRMLSYHAEAEGSDKNLLTADQLEMLSRWLCK